MHIAVASDLHAGSAGSRHSFLRDGASRLAWKSHPVEALFRLIARERLQSDLLISPGDLTHECSVDGLRVGHDSIVELAHSLNCPWVCTIGNHDVDSRHHHGDDIFAPARALSPDFPLGDRDASLVFWDRGYAVLDLGTASLLVLNSTFDHSDPSAIEHGSINADILDSLDELLSNSPLRELRLAVVHHHPHLHEDFGLGAADVMHGGQQLIDLLRRHGFQLIIHGHKHHPKLSYAAGDASSPTVFAAGSFSYINYGELASNTRNVVHVIDLQPALSAELSVQGTIRSWQYNSGVGWNPATLESVGFPFHAGFGCRKTVDEIVAAIRGLIVARTPWAELQESLPYLRYILPATRTSVLNRLRLENSIRVLRDDAGEPLELAPGSAT
jgi:3',5'-cyclic AMP phosphodiesterase CpdA